MSWQQAKILWALAVVFAASAVLTLAWLGNLRSLDLVDRGAEIRASETLL